MLDPLGDITALQYILSLRKVLMKNKPPQPQLSIFSLLNRSFAIPMQQIHLILLSLRQLHLFRLSRLHFEPSKLLFMFLLPLLLLQLLFLLLLFALPLLVVFILLFSQRDGIVVHNFLDIHNFLGLGVFLLVEFEKLKFELSVVLVVHLFRFWSQLGRLDFDGSTF